MAKRHVVVLSMAWSEKSFDEEGGMRGMEADGGCGGVNEDGWCLGDDMMLCAELM
jgi:hypothetical protein